MSAMMPVGFVPDDVSLLLVSEFDSPSVRFFLRGLPWRLSEVPDCREAVAFLRDHTSVSVVVACARLRDGTWADLLEAFHALPRAPELIVYCHHADEYLWAEVLNLGAFDLLPAPLVREELVGVVGMAHRAWQNRALNLARAAAAKTA